MLIVLAKQKIHVHTESHSKAKSALMSHKRTNKNINTSYISTNRTRTVSRITKG